MLTIYKDRLIHIEWTIYKGTSSVREDFTRALVKCFLIGPREKYLVNATAQSGTLYIELPQGLEEGAYSIEAIYVKNQGNLTPRREPLSPCNAPDYRRTPYPPFKPHDARYNDRCIMRSRRDCLFAITEYEQEEEGVPTASSGEVTLRFSTSTSSYGYDGLSAYEIAVMRGDFNGSEGEWLMSLRSPIRMSVISQNDYNSLKEAEMLNKYTFYVIPDSAEEKVSKMYIGKLEFPLCSSGTDPEPEVYILYGTILDEITDFSQITLEMIESSTNHIVKMKPQTLPKTSLGVLDAGSKVIVLIPNGYNYVATKDNGIGGKVPFDESIMGANGQSIILGSNTYKMYGEFMTIRGELFIYID